MSIKLKKPSILARFCARLTDYCLLFGLGVLITLILPLEVNTIFYLVLATAVPLLQVPIEAYLLSSWGTTPGKALFSIIVRSHTGLKLSLQESYKSARFSKNSGILLQGKMGFLHKLCAYLFVIMLAVFSIFSKPITEAKIGGKQQQKVAGWVSYISEEAGFSVHFPKNPTVIAKEVEHPSSKNPVNYNEYTSESDPEVVYTVSYIDLPKKYGWVSSKRILRGVLDILMKLEPGSKLIKKEFVEHDAYPAVNFHYQKGESEVLGRLIRVKHRLFKLTISYPTSKVDKIAPSYEFFETFNALKSESK